MSEPVPCPKCGKAPKVSKGATYWKVFCESLHMRPIGGHRMRTKRDAISEWNKVATPPEDPIMEPEAIPLPMPHHWFTEEPLTLVASLYEARRDDPHLFATKQHHGAFTAEQVRAAVLQERERCARVVDGVCPMHEQIAIRTVLAAAIRSGTAPAQEEK